MSEAKHTSAPWAVNPTNAQVDAFDGVDDDGKPLPVCQLLWPTDKRSEGETEANARLIAAAPDLLEACLAFSRIGKTPADIDAAYAKANAAIRKATT